MPLSTKTPPEVIELLNQHERPVILLEGRRSIPEDFKATAQALARHLAEIIPHAHFRSGNADGSDHAFSSGVMEVDPARLEIFAPYATHKAKSRFEGAHYLSPDQLGEDEEENLARITAEVSPKAKGLIKGRHQYPRSRAKAAYLIRDTLKVTGYRDLPAPTLALFYVNPDNPGEGGTGHTIRVCQQQNIPHYNQSDWQTWLPE